MGRGDRAGGLLGWGGGRLGPWAEVGKAVGGAGGRTLRNARHCRVLNHNNNTAANNRVMEEKQITMLPKTSTAASQPQNSSPDPGRQRPPPPPQPHSATPAARLLTRCSHSRPRLSPHPALRYSLREMLGAPSGKGECWLSAGWYLKACSSSPGGGGARILL